MLTKSLLKRCPLLRKKRRVAFLKSIVNPLKWINDEQKSWKDHVYAQNYLLETHKLGYTSWNCRPAQQKDETMRNKQRENETAHLQ